MLSFPAGWEVCAVVLLNWISLMLLKVDITGRGSWPPNGNTSSPNAVDRFVWISREEMELGDGQNSSLKFITSAILSFLSIPSLSTQAAKAEGTWRSLVVGNTTKLQALMCGLTGCICSENRGLYFRWGMLIKLVCMIKCGCICKHCMCCLGYKVPLGTQLTLEATIKTSYVSFAYVWLQDETDAEKAEYKKYIFLNRAFYVTIQKPEETSTKEEEKVKLAQKYNKLPMRYKMWDIKVCNGFLTRINKQGKPQNNSQ